MSEKTKKIKDIIVTMVKSWVPAIISAISGV